MVITLDTDIQKWDLSVLFKFHGEFDVRMSAACTKTRNTRIRRNTGTPENRNTGTPEHRNNGTPEHRNTEHPETPEHRTPPEHRI